MASSRASHSASLQAGGVASATPGAGTELSDDIQVMVVDDSAVIRGLVKSWIAETKGMEVSGSCSNGRKAIEMAGRLKPHVMILDIEMPEMDGIEALPEILKVSPHTRVVMASTLTLRNADISLRAMTLGAADFLPKPDSGRGRDGADEFRRELLEKVRVLGEACRRRTGGRAKTPVSMIAPAKAPMAPQDISLRKDTGAVPRVLAIGSSTGGPQALFDVFGKIGNTLANVPILVVQHMPPSFTRILAEKLGRITGLDAHEAIDGEQVLPGHMYVAPGDYHMRVRKKGAGMVIELDQDPKVHFCRPAVDPMFASVAESFGSAALAVVLTGMGYDGRDGGRLLADAGSTVYAQDEATSVVWGMPGACATAGICTGVFPLDEISTAITRRFAGSKS